MAKNLAQEGTIIRATAPYNRNSGEGAQIGLFFGVSLLTVLSGVVSDFQVEGVFDIAKAAGAWTEWSVVYWDNAAKLATLTSTSNLRIGVACLNDSDAMAAGGDATGRVRLDGVGRFAVAS